MKRHAPWLAISGLIGLSGCNSQPKFDDSEATTSPQMNELAASTPEGAGSQVNATILVSPSDVPAVGQFASKPPD